MDEQACFPGYFSGLNIRRIQLHVEKRLFSKKTNEEPAPQEKSGRFSGKLVAGLEKSQAGFVETVEHVLSGRQVDERRLFERTEEILIQVDCGVEYVRVYLVISCGNGRKRKDHGRG